MISGLELKKTNWETDQDALSIVRRRVFIEEQNVPEALELDEYDKGCAHVLALDARRNPVAVGRIKLDGQIGRMAVLPQYRNLGIGSAVLHALLELASELGCEPVYLHAQITAMPFYQKHGFVACSDEFIDAGIMHRTMKLAD